MAIKYNYTPFLKFKANEVAGLSVLSPKLKAEVTPFFDLPRKNGMTRAEFERTVAVSYTHLDVYKRQLLNRVSITKRF